MLTTGDVARMLDVSPNTVVSYVQKGFLRCRRLPSGGRRQYREEDVEAFIRSLEEGGTDNNDTEEV